MTETWTTLQQLLGGLPEPVAITFRDTVPEAMPRIKEAGPAGCSYWKLAADGQVFYTMGADHLNCPIGAYTHGAELTPGAEAQLGEMIGTMTEIRYLKADEVPSIPRRTEPLRFVVYAPLSKSEGTPDVVLFRGNARHVMLLSEAALACGAMSPSLGMGRPACSVIAAAIDSNKVTTSWGCIGNRVYTELPDSELYVGVPGGQLDNVIEALGAIVGANSQLEQYHRGRRAAYA